MVAPKGNRFYLLRAKDGRERKYKTPDDLWEACCKYFHYTTTNPIKEQKAFCGKKGILKTQVNKARAMTLAGMYVRIGISEGTFLSYRKIDEYKLVINLIDNIIYAQKFEGAAAGIFNANIIARDLALKDHTALSSPDGSMSPRNFNDFYADQNEDKEDEEPDTKSST